MTHRQILTYLFMLAIIPLSATAFPPPSPAGRARTSIPLAVEPHEKLTTTWGQLKQ